MKHINHVSKALPATASGYELPRNIFDIRSWTDIVLVIGLTAEKFLDWIFGGYIVPRDIWQ